MREGGRHDVVTRPTPGSFFFGIYCFIFTANLNILWDRSGCILCWFNDIYFLIFCVVVQMKYKTLAVVFPQCFFLTNEPPAVL